MSKNIEFETSFINLNESDILLKLEKIGAEETGLAVTVLKLFIIKKVIAL